MCVLRGKIKSDNAEKEQIFYAIHLSHPHHCLPPLLCRESTVCTSSLLVDKSTSLRVGDSIIK